MKFQMSLLTGEVDIMWNRKKNYLWHSKIKSHPEIAKPKLAKKIEWKAREIVLFKIRFWDNILDKNEIYLVNNTEKPVFDDCKSDSSAMPDLLRGSSSSTGDIHKQLTASNSCTGGLLRKV